MKKKLLLILSLLMLILSITSCSISKDVDAESAYDSSIPKTEVVTSYSEIYKSIYPSCYGVRNIISSSTSMIILDYLQGSIQSHCQHCPSN